jgi:hypothetical protein
MADGTLVKLYQQVYRCTVPLHPVLFLFEREGVDDQMIK